MTRETLTILLPPLALVVVGIAAYITVVKLTTPDIPTLTALPQSTVAAVPDASASASITPVPTPPSTAIRTSVALPSATSSAALQRAVDAGSEPWRKDALEVAKRDGAAYGFVASDAFASASSSPRGTTTVTAQHAGATYAIDLQQPQQQGAAGIWTISAIRATP